MIANSERAVRRPAAPQSARSAPPGQTRFCPSTEELRRSHTLPKSGAGCEFAATAAAFLLPATATRGARFPVALGLDRRATHRAVRAEDATITRLGSQSLIAARAIHRQFGTRWSSYVPSSLCRTAGT